MHGRQTSKPAVTSSRASCDSRTPTPQLSRVSMAGSTKEIKGMSKNHLHELKTELLRPIQTSLCLPSANSYSKYSKYTVWNSPYWLPIEFSAVGCQHCTRHLPTFTVHRTRNISSAVQERVNPDHPDASQKKVPLPCDVCASQVSASRISGFRAEPVQGATKPLEIRIDADICRHS